MHRRIESNLNREPKPLRKIKRVERKKENPKYNSLSNIYILAFLVKMFWAPKQRYANLAGRKGY